MSDIDFLSGRGFCRLTLYQFGNLFLFFHEEKMLTEDNQIVHQY